MDTRAHAAAHDIEIPYTIHARPDTGLYNGKLGIWLFLASEVMLFGALFSTLVLLRTGAPVWPISSCAARSKTADLTNFSAASTFFDFAYTAIMSGPA